MQKVTSLEEGTKLLEGETDRLNDLVNQMKRETESVDAQHKKELDSLRTQLETHQTNWSSTEGQLRDALTTLEQEKAALTQRVQVLSVNIAKCDTPSFSS